MWLCGKQRSPERTEGLRAFRFHTTVSSIDLQALPSRSSYGKGCLLGSRTDAWVFLSQRCPAPASKASCQSMCSGGWFRGHWMNTELKFSSAAALATSCRVRGSCSAKPMGPGTRRKTDPDAKVSDGKPCHKQRYRTAGHGISGFTCEDAIIILLTKVEPVC